VDLNEDAKYHFIYNLITTILDFGATEMNALRSLMQCSVLVNHVHCLCKKKEISSYSSKSQLFRYLDAKVIDGRGWALMSHDWGYYLSCSRLESTLSFSPSHENNFI